ncbi:hypothetical protein SERLADRAFT_469947 [Serpula lacrymans var. lacrymans S7.9]|uniref:Uncharacterized protein n=1 Tax=Serpula lacrymans var. lacrymans (strain S7.9) TaxID=578457 RepID=F8NYP0_SERL9|nr:uncharacterized protein SERLADRAFT_469947 [Serpula lacrymans var. lacrymans S7.9]EGO23711.1 hypothetical protein SERLADRAFT_469947 [Serpula lacrymans var. lacrymans S7.9]
MSAESSGTTASQRSAEHSAKDDIFAGLDLGAGDLDLHLVRPDNSKRDAAVSDSLTHGRYLLAA